MCLCAVWFCDVSIQTLRNTTLIFLETHDILTTIKGLLWQVGLGYLLQNLRKIEELAPQLAS
jgi:hypothetical protein